MNIADCILLVTPPEWASYFEAAGISTNLNGDRTRASRKGAMLSVASIVLDSRQDNAGGLSQSMTKIHVWTQVCVNIESIASVANSTNK